jgi:hypothetical protein
LTCQNAQIVGEPVGFRQTRRYNQSYARFAVGVFLRQAERKSGEGTGATG